MPSYQTTRALLAAGSVVRIAYGVAALLAPERLAVARLAPDTHELADPRLTLRAFGGHQLVVGGTALAAVRSRDRRLLAGAATLSMLIDALDVGSALLEIRARGRADPTLTGGIALSGAGVISSALARRLAAP